MTELKYVAGHLQWIKNNPKFVPKDQPIFSDGNTYYDIMNTVYVEQRDHPFINEWAKRMWVADKLWHKQTFSLSKEIEKEVEKLEPTSNGWWFVTIGFNHDTWSIGGCTRCIEKILAQEWVISAKANFELHRENGEHPHCHFLMSTKEPKSKILEKIFRPLYTRTVVFSKNFIDVKPMMDYHLKYIHLDKVENKMPCVEKDIEWRTKNNIPDYEKNWEAALAYFNYELV